MSTLKLSAAGSDIEMTIAEGSVYELCIDGMCTADSIAVEEGLSVIENDLGAETPRSSIDDAAARCGIA